MAIFAEITENECVKRGTICQKRQSDQYYAIPRKQNAI